MTAKELLRERIEELSEDEARDWLGLFDETFPREPLVLTPEQEAMIERSLADSEAGRVVPQDEVRRRLGINR
ncbi:MAG: hypothetical protein WD557_05105 [Dehalococcoidia bacterium]